ncbi:MAG: outer membrane protein assembly factor BamD [Planctomycetota bacterium]
MRGVGLVACLVGLLAAGLAVAQPSYELTDDGFVPLDVPEPGTPEAELAEARRMIAEERPKEALKLLDRWFRDHPNHPLTVEARLLNGDAHAAGGDYYKALFDYEDVITFYPASEQFRTALRREYEIGVLYTSGFKRKLFGLRILPARDDGAELLIRVQERAPGSDLGQRASLALADHYFETRQLELASEAYDLYLLNYPESDQRQWAMLRLIQASLARFKGPEFDGTGLIDARERLEQYRDRFPASAERIGADALLVRIRESLARRDHATAAWYDRTRKRVAAGLLYRRLIEEYPDTSAARDAVRRLDELGLEPVVAE